MVMSILVPLVFAAASVAALVSPPRYGSGLYGYRSSWARRSPDARGFANRSWAVATLLLLPAVYASGPLVSRLVSGDLLICFIFLAQIAVALIACAIVELLLRARFDELGDCR